MKFLYNQLIKQIKQHLLMNKILLIIQREYLTRVKKKSFIVMTILGPLLMASLILAPLIISKFDKDQTYTIKVIDQTPKIFTTILPSSEEIMLINDSITLVAAKTSFDPDKYYGILYLPSDFIKNPNSAVLYTEKQANIQVTQYIERVMKDEIEKGKLQAEGIKQETLESIKTDVNLKTFTLSGKENNALLTTAVGFAGGIAIYMFIFLYGVQVMRGVIEEKTNRIVEVIISSVKPFQLMMGKILGIALVGLTQFMLWIVLTFLISSTITTYIAKEKMDAKNVAMSLNTQQANGIDKLSDTKEMEKSAMESIMSNIDSINIPLVLTCFVIYFLGGYLLYSALFAAIGAAVDNETETQQFMLPVTIPLILSFVVAQSVITNPESQLSFWFSIIPLTSPVVMMVRVAFGVPAWQLILSISLLILGFIGTTWLAARIYRTGILLYGKKVNYKELSKWLFYKN
jgi:ABC-2 type transport system permease protein